jgi:hypothetical protein
VHADSSTSSPSSAWLIGATFGGYFTLVYVLRFWGEGFLLPASDVVQLTPEPKSHILEIGLAVVGLVVTLLGVLQSIYSVQVSEKLTRISLWLNFFAILSFCVLRFGGEYILPNWALFIFFISIIAAFPLGLMLSVVNILGGWLRRSRLPEVEPHG